MSLGSTRRWVAASTVLASLAMLPGVGLAQPVDPSAVSELPRIARALLAFGLVGAVGGGFLAWSPPFLDRAVDDTMARPTVAVVYGFVAFVLVLFVSFYATDFVSRVGVADTPLGYVALAVLVGGVASVGGLGHLVVGTVLTDLFGTRRPWQGLAVGATISAVPWLVLPLLGALAVWVVVAAIGVGGRTRTWVHSERTVSSELDA